MADKKQEIAHALVQLAWADGELTPQEAELLAKYLRRFGFDEEEARQAWLTSNEPVNYESLRSLMPEEAERNELMRELLAISLTDEMLTFSEFDLIEKMAKALGISDETMEKLRIDANPPS